jgi:TIR domain
MAKMVEKASETTIEEILENLLVAQRQGRRVGLFLGHRAGALFSNNTLYEALEKTVKSEKDLSALLTSDTLAIEDMLRLHLQSMSNLSPLDKFKKCHDTLRDHFSEKGIHTILVHAIAPVRYRKEDDLLAQLIKKGFFNPVITTSIDTLLEDACKVFCGMQQPGDYQVINYGKDSIDKIEQYDATSTQIVKIFGDLDQLKYKTVGNEFNLKDDPNLRDFLSKKLADEIVVIGYDPIWDGPIEQAFSAAGKVVWYIDEELPQQGTHLAQVLNQGRGRYLISPQESYSDFLQKLSNLMSQNGSHDGDGTRSSSIAPQSSIQEKKQAFISYSHNDSQHLERLRTHLKGYRHVYGTETILDCWDDTRIMTGANWQMEIEAALANTKVATLLVNADFLASEYIYVRELPFLLKAAKAKEVILLSIILGPCPFKRTALSDYQAINKETEPIIGMDLAAQEAIWERAAERICDILYSQI